MTRGAQSIDTAKLKQIIAEKVFVRPAETTPIASRGALSRDPQWFFDFRAIVFDANVLDYIAEEFWRRYGDRYPFQVGGLESAAIPLITAIVLKGRERGTPVHGFFLRKSRKRDGLMRMFEGGLTDDPVILVDDSINSGQSTNRLLLALKEAGRRVSDIFVILRFRSTEAYGELARVSGARIDSIYSLEDFGMPLLQKSPDVPQQSFEILWRHSGGKPSFNMVVEKSAPVTDGRRVYVGSDNGVFWAIDAATGKPVWEFKIGRHPKWKGIFSSPALHDGIVYFGAYDGNVYALEAETGEKKWVYAEADWVGSSPLVAPDLGLLFIGLEFGLLRKRGGIVALKLSSGERAWGHKMPEYTHGSPLYIKDERIVVIGSNDGVLYAYDAKSGEPRWHFKTGGPIKASAAYDPKRRLVIFGSWDGSFYALDAKTGIKKFSFASETPIFSTPLVHGDIAYSASLDKHLYAIHLDSGESMWSFLTHGRIFSSPVVARGSVWIGSNDGRLYELDPETGELRSFFQATERIVNAIACDERTGHLYVPTVANELYCIRKIDV